MEITSEIKAKVFAQYWGKTFMNGMGGQSSLSFIDLSDICNGKIKAKLLLKPLSAITDEDAIEASKIVMQRHDRHYENVDYSICDRHEKWIEVKVKAKEEFCPIIVRIELRSVSVMKSTLGERNEFFKDKDLFAPETFTVCFCAKQPASPRWS